MTFKKKSRFSREERQVRKILKDIKQHDWIYSMDQAGKAELESLRKVVESISGGYGDIIENLGCVHDLFHAVEIEPKKGYFAPRKDGLHKSSHFSLHLSEVDILKIFSGLLPTIRNAKRKHGSFRLDDYVQLESDKRDKGRIGDRLWLGEVRYYEDSESYTKRIKEYADRRGLDIESLKHIPREPYQASKEVYEIYLENLRPNRNSFNAFAKIVPQVDSE